MNPDDRVAWTTFTAVAGWFTAMMRYVFGADTNTRLKAMEARLDGRLTTIENKVDRLSERVSYIEGKMGGGRRIQ